MLFIFQCADLYIHSLFEFLIVIFARNWTKLNVIKVGTCVCHNSKHFTCPLFCSLFLSFLNLNWLKCVQVERINSIFKYNAIFLDAKPHGLIEICKSLVINNCLDLLKIKATCYQNTRRHSSHNICNRQRRKNTVFQITTVVLIFFL